MNNRMKTQTIKNLYYSWYLKIFSKLYELLSEYDLEEFLNIIGIIGLPLLIGIRRLVVHNFWDAVQKKCNKKIASKYASFTLCSSICYDLWPDPIFWACADYSFRILSQSDLSDLTGSSWIADFRCWTGPEVAILGADQKERGLLGREWKNSVMLT